MTSRKPSPLATRIVSLSLAASALFAGVAGSVGAQSNGGARGSVITSRAERAAEFPLLSRYASELTTRRGDAGADARAAEIQRAVEILSRDSRNSPLLITDAGADAASVARGVARRIAEGRVPASLRGANVFALSPGSLAFGAKTSDEFVARLRSLLEEASQSRGRVVLFVEDFHQLAGTYTSREASDAVRSAIERAGLRFIGSTTSAVYDEHIAKDASLAKLVEPVRLSSDDSPATRERDEQAAKVSNVLAGDKLSSDLRALAASAKPGERVGVILQSDDLNSPRLEALMRKYGVEVSSRMSQIGALRVEVPAAALKELAASGETRYLSPDREVRSLGHVTSTTGTDLVRTQSSGCLLGLVCSTTTLDGDNIGIAVIDSGIDAGHKTFAVKLTDLSGSRIKVKKDFTPEGKGDKDPYGHGTHVAASAAGISTVSGSAYEGVARGADIISLRVLDSSGQGKSSDLLAALNWILSPADPSKPLSSSNPTNATKFNIKVVNMSLGTPAVDSYTVDPLCKAARKLVDAGIVVVAAAGNNGKDAQGNKVYGLIHSPGDEPSVITVGASNTFGTDARGDDGIATFSSRGPTRGFTTDASGVRHFDNIVKPDLVAPGNKLVYAEADDGGSNRNMLVRQNPQLDTGITDSDNKKLMYLSGTSMATPLVAGTAALLLQANPRLTPNMVKMILMYTAQPLAGFNQLEQGSGELNVEGAVRLAKLVRTDINGGTKQGDPLLATSSLPDPKTTIAGQQFTWAQGVMLKHSYATGSGLIAKYQTVYGLGMVLGDGTVLGDGSVSGDGIMLADGFLMSDGIMLADQITTSSGMVLGDGAPFIPCGFMMSDGIMLADGMVIGDGFLMSDGFMMSDGIMLADSALEAMSAQVGGDNTPSMR
jgi:subtilisin family serine protease